MFLSAPRFPHAVVDYGSFAQDVVGDRFGAQSCECGHVPFRQGKATSSSSHESERFC